MNFSASPSAAFGTNAGMDLVITPLIVNLVGQNTAAGLTIATQPSDAQVRNELYNLITTAVGRTPAGQHPDHHDGGLHRGARQRHDSDQVVASHSATHCRHERESMKKQTRPDARRCRTRCAT